MACDDGVFVDIEAGKIVSVRHRNRCALLCLSVDEGDDPVSSVQIVGRDVDLVDSVCVSVIAEKIGSRHSPPVYRNRNGPAIPDGDRPFVSVHGAPDEDLFTEAQIFSGVVLAEVLCSDPLTGTSAARYTDLVEVPVPPAVVIEADVSDDHVVHDLGICNRVPGDAQICLYLLLRTAGIDVENRILGAAVPGKGEKVPLVYSGSVAPHELVVGIRHAPCVRFQPHPEPCCGSTRFVKRKRVDVCFRSTAVRLADDSRVRGV